VRGQPGRSGHVSVWLRFAALVRRVVVWRVALGLSVTAAGAASADPSRFVPWTRAETPPLTLKDLGGRERSLADYRGKAVLLNFWATWCEPCRDEMPSMRRLRDELGRQGFEVIAVNFGESPSRVRDFLERERLDLTVLLDPDRAAARAWRVRILPSSFLIGVDGRVRFSVLGELEWSGTEAGAVVRSILPPRGALRRATVKLAGRGGR
jgi:peroxiredoxin